MIDLLFGLCVGTVLGVLFESWTSRKLWLELTRHNFRTLEKYMPEHRAEIRQGLREIEARVFGKKE